jgi:hypothetical protein
MPKKKPPSEHVIHVVLKVSRRPPQLLTDAQYVHDQLAKNVETFPDADPPLADCKPTSRI